MCRDVPSLYYVEAKSCKVLMMKLVELGKPMVDGVYEITIKDGSVMKMYCDMTRNGGGWTLIVASAQNDWTSSDMIRARNIDKPSLLKDYSILKYVDEIKDDYNIEEDRFEYRLEAHARGRNILMNLYIKGVFYRRIAEYVWNVSGSR